MPTAAVQHEFTIRRKIFTLFGAKFHIMNAKGDVIGFSKQKAFKLKEDIRVFTDDSMSTELLAISTRSVIDFSAAYDVTDSASGTKLGALRRKGFKSILRDEWMVLDPNDTQIAAIKEDSTMGALVRRFLPMGNLVPQRFNLLDGADNQFAEYHTHFNPFVHRMTVSVYNTCPISPHLVLAAGILLVAIEGRQKQ